ncbi:MAG: hypothetical protein JNM34_01775 [Chthonomonadaceae bacterium]|nr:hypothetical protein [Chthonomonadaceae bacterium]
MMVSLGWAALLAISGLGLPASSELKYRMFDLGPGQRGRMAGLSVNSSGWIVGDTRNGPGWYWRPDVGWRQFPTPPGGEFTNGVSINDSCQVACYVVIAGLKHAAVWNPDSGIHVIQMPEKLRLLDVISIGRQGKMVGQCLDKTTSAAHAWLYDPLIGTIDLGMAPDGDTTAARHVNDAGVVAGWHREPGWNYSANLWTPDGKFIDLGHPPLGGVYVYGINNAGDLALQAATIGVPEDARWHSGEWVSFGRIAGTNQEWAVFALTDQRWAFGTAFFDGADRAVIWRPGFGSRFIDEYVDDSKTGYTIHAVYSASKNGLLSGSASKPGDRFTRPVLFVPYPKKSAGDL